MRENGRPLYRLQGCILAISQGSAGTQSDIVVMVERWSGSTRENDGMWVERFGNSEGMN